MSQNRAAVHAYACAYHNSTTSTLYIPDNVPSAMMLKLYVHELAHCNGWKHPQPHAPLPLAKPN